jgi:hypothetical protein
MGGETGISLDCGRFYGPFIRPRMRMSEGMNELFFLNHTVNITLHIAKRCFLARGFIALQHRNVFQNFNVREMSYTSVIMLLWKNERFRSSSCLIQKPNCNNNIYIT